MFWEKYTYTEVKQKVFEALSKNTNYRTKKILGIPGTFLDDNIFYEDAPFSINIQEMELMYGSTFSYSKK